MRGHKITWATRKFFLLQKVNPMARSGKEASGGKTKHQTDYCPIMSTCTDHRLSLSLVSLRYALESLADVLCPPRSLKEDLHFLPSSGTESGTESATQSSESCVRAHRSLSKTPKAVP